MKRFVAMLFVITILLGSVALADVDKEIRFNDIPWGTDISEVKRIIKSLWSENSDVEEFSIHSYPYNWMNDYDYGYDGLAVGIYTYHGYDKYKVAGYDVEFTLLLAYYDYDANSYRKDLDATHFCQAVIEFDMEYDEVDDAFEDLSNKLTRLYGKSTEVKYDADVDGLEWYGINDTVVRLERQNDDGFGVKYIMLIYSIRNLDDILIELNKRVEEDKINNYVPVDEDNITGL